LDPGGSGVDAVWDFQGPEMASFLGGRPCPLSLVSCARALVYSGNQELILALESVIAEVEARDPLPPSGVGHAADFYARGIASEAGLPPKLAPTAEEDEEAHPLLSSLPEGFLALHPGSGAPRKNWPPERFAALAERLSDKRPFLVVEGPADRAACEAVLRIGRARLASGLRPRILGAVLARAGLFVGNDSGVSHLAAAYAAPVLALFGPTDPAVWSPLGARVKVLCAPEGQMDALGLEAVLEAAEDV
jgi:ADP-heptose:LPS heptosyltransferase